MTMRKFMFGVLVAFTVACGLLLATRVQAAQGDNNPCKVFQHCTVEQMDAFLEDVCGVEDGGKSLVGSTTTTTTPSDASTTTTTLEQRCTPGPNDIDCRHYNRLRTKGYNCAVRVNGKRGQCKGYYTRRDGFVIARGCSIVVY